MVDVIEQKRRELQELCRRNHIRRMSLFGSAANDAAGPDSDFDILVEFDQGHTPGFRFYRIQDELSDILGRRVDLHTPSSLSRYFRDQVQRDAQVVCARD